MSEFKVKTEWTGWIKTTDILVASFWSIRRFMTIEYVYDLDVTTSTVELAGPGTEKIDDPGELVATKVPSFHIGSLPVWLVWFSETEMSDRFDGRGEGWRVREIACAEPDEVHDDNEGGEETGDNEGTVGIGVLPDVEPKGIEVRYKAHLDSGTISVETAAPSIKLTIRGQEVTLPIGSATTKTTGGIAIDALGKYQLCPDGAGDYTAAELDQDPADATVVHPHGITINWAHVK